MTPDRCSMAPLVEVRRDGRLAPRDVASVDRHLATCAACRALDGDLARIREHVRAPLPHASPLEHQRARVALLQRAAEGNGRRADRPLPLRIFPVAAAIAAVALGVWFGLSRQGAPIAQQSPSPAAPSAIVAAAAAPPNLRTETTVRPEEGARFSRSTEGGLDLVTLRTGAINVGVKPLGPGERFIVRTDDAEVEVRGTLFRVEADDGHIVSVIVTEGKVEVRSRGTSALVPAGGSWHAVPQAPPAPVAPAPTSSGLAAPPSTSSARADVPGRAPRSSASAHAPPSVPATDSTAAAAPSSAPSSAPSAPTRDHASQQFAEAVQAMERGDYTAASRRLDAFHAGNPDDARAEEAAYLNSIALQRAGRSAEAAEAARRYLARYPNGSFRTEAAAIAGPR